MINNLPDIKKIFEQDKNEIIAKYKGIGAGIGMRNQHYAIIIYTDDPKATLADDAKWKEIPLVLEYTGKFIPY